MAIRPTIPNQQMPIQNQPQAKSQREIELENENQELMDKTYLANMRDEVFFRIQLLSAINQMSMVFQRFLDELKQSQGEQQQ